jgi:DNA sulfur modification protein DndB
MAKLFPGVRARMGRWTYYMVRMTMDDLKSVRFAREIESGNGLDDALQRALNEPRSKNQIATYLQRQPDRFFNSIVIASIGGNPKWFPISVEDNPALALVADDENLMGSFGILRFDGNENYFALDGQHRLNAIKSLLDSSNELYRNKPEGFEKEEQSVVLVVPSEAETPEAFKERFRRLFGHLNRYAKPMDKATSIIMDEDDAIAIATRRLFSDHEFFSVVGPQKDSLRIDTNAGSNITNPNAPHLTKLEVLYEMNTILLSSSRRELQGWFGTNESTADFIRFRPEEQVLDDIYNELSIYWDAILKVLPVLRSDASKMRNHNLIGAEETRDEQDNLLFWPLGQIALARVIRALLDLNESQPTDFDSAVSALAPLKRISWDLTASPWVNFILVPNDRGTGWKMRSEDRAKVQLLAVSLITSTAFYGADIDQEQLEGLKDDWARKLVPAMNKEEANSHWKKALVNLGIDSE